MSEQLQVIVRSVSTITPQPQINSTIKAYLTPWDLDLMHLEYDQYGLLYRSNRNNTTSSSDYLIHRLKTSLGRALHFFPLFSGRLVTTASDHDSSYSTCFHIEHSEHTKGSVLFIHAASRNPNTTVSDLIFPSSFCLESIQALYPFHGARSHEGVFWPLFGVKVTQFVDGFFIGWSLNQMLGDGSSFFHFINTWAEISRGDGRLITPSKLPFHKRELLTLNLTGSRGIFVDNKHLTIDYSDHSWQVSSDLRSKVFHFEKESISRLKARSIQEIAAKKTISSLQATIAHVWRSIIRCRFATNAASIAHETTTFEIPMDARSRLSPSLPEGYFGNAVFPGLVTLQASEILKNGLGWTALEINKMVDSWKEPIKVEKLYSDWIKNPSFADCSDDPNNWFVLICSPRFDVYGNDFGWGSPVALRTGKANACNGRIIVSEQAGMTHVEMCLDSKTLCALEEVEEFMQFVSLDGNDIDRNNNLVRKSAL